MSARLHRLGAVSASAITVAASAAALLATAAPAGAATAQAFCVRSTTNVDVCTVTIDLTSDMNETLTAVMPDTNPWQLNELNGTPGSAVSWGPTGHNFEGGANSGTQWTDTLMTGTEQSGAQATLTFGHVTATPPPVTVPNYTISVTRVGKVKHKTQTTITSVVTPKPAAGKVVLQRLTGISWQTVKTFTFDTKHKRWAVKFTAPLKKGVVAKLRVTVNPPAGATTAVGRSSAPFTITAT